MSAPGRNAEDQNKIGLVSKELRQIAIDRCIAGRKNVDRANNVSKRGPAPACKRASQNRAGI
jgi:hypothetical protein